MSFAATKSALPHARLWHHVDASERILGRLATRVTLALMGKYKPTFDPSIDCGDYVVVTNASGIKVTGRKFTDKIYKSHSGFPGGLKEIPYNKMVAKHPTWALEKAVKRMLPKNRLRNARMARLLVYANDKHPYESNIFKDYETASRTLLKVDGQETTATVITKMNMDRDALSSIDK